MSARRRGFSLLELMIVVAIILTLLAVSAPHLVRSKMIANEAVARESLHTLNSALFQYWTLYRAYPTSLANLGSGADVGATSAELIDPVLASGRRGGYTFSYVPVQDDADGTVSAYTITATPVAPGITGDLSFVMSQTGAVPVLAGSSIAPNPSPQGDADAPQK